MAVLAWLYSDQIIKALTAGLNSIEGIGSKERTQRLATIDQQLLAAEHEEETLVTLALSKGMEVHRRLGVNVLAVSKSKSLPSPSWWQRNRFINLGRY